VVLAVLLAACGGDTKTASTTSSSSTSTTALTGFGTQRVATPSPDDEFTTKLVALRIGDHGQFVRVVFEFAKPGVPPYVVEPASPPFVQDGSGKEVDVAGERFLTVRLDQTQAHNEDGSPTVQPARRAGLSVVTEVVRLGDFEGVVNYVIGLQTSQPFRVTELQSPPRLVVDIAA
jgi:hypothetical protein